jgi:vacuolar-type H+-ATPase subunit H
LPRWLRRRPKKSDRSSGEEAEKEAKEILAERHDDHEALLGQLITHQTLVEAMIYTALGR